MADVFVSYKREDRAYAASVAAALQRTGLSVFYDSHIDVGESWDRAIEREIYAAAAVVVLWTELSVESDWVRREAREGGRRNVLVPALIRDCRLPLEFTSHQTADLRNWKLGQRHGEFDRLVRRLSQIVGPVRQKVLESAAHLEQRKNALRDSRIRSEARVSAIEADYLRVVLQHSALMDLTLKNRVAVERRLDTLAIDGDLKLTETIKHLALREVFAGELDENLQRQVYDYVIERSLRFKIHLDGRRMTIDDEIAVRRQHGLPLSAVHAEHLANGQASLPKD